MAPAGLLNSFLAAIQASLSVLLVVFYGVLTARFKLLDGSTGKTISKVCVKVFLPALLFTKIGSELHASSAHRYLIILIWAFICHIISFLIGISAHLLFKFPDWITAAIMFNNTTSYPLLLIVSLDETGILSNLIITDETSRDAIERAKSYFLVFATVSSCLTFAVGPRLMDSEHAYELDDKDSGDSFSDDDEEAVSPTHETEQTTLLRVPSRTRKLSLTPNSFFPSRPREDSNVTYDRRPSYIPKRHWYNFGPRTQWWLLFFYDFLNAPLLGAVAGAIIGLIPALHRAFFYDTYDGGIFTAWLTTSFQSIGQLFVPLPLLVAGVSLYLSRVAANAPESQQAKLPWLTTLFVLVVRFVVWPIASISVIYALASKTDILGDDPMLWFTMMLMPTGPSAMKLITMVQVSDADEADEHKIAKILTISYAISPLLAFTVVGALRASAAAI